MDWLKKLWNGICNSTPVIAVKNLWTGFFGKDTLDFYTRKDLDKASCPAGAVIVFRGKNDWFSAAIRKVTNKWGNHIGVATGTDASGMIHTIEAEAQGITADTLKRALNPNSQLIIFIKKDLTAMQTAALVGFLNGKVGEPYGADELANFVLDTNFNDKATDFCSELAVSAYNSIGIKTSNKEPQKSAPGDLMQYFLSEEGKQAGWMLWDTYNITVADVGKLTC